MISTGYPQLGHKGSTRYKQRLMGWFSRRGPSTEELRAAVHELSLRVKRAEDDISQLGGSLERLRGRFYSLKGVDGPPSPRTKEEILRDYHANQRK